MKRPEHPYPEDYPDGEDWVTAYTNFVHDNHRWENCVSRALAILESLRVASGMSDGLTMEMFADALTHMHRTEQQLTANSVMKILQAMAVMDYDLRNEATVKMAQTACAAIDGIALPFI